jgi:hypothetical protein
MDPRATVFRRRIPRRQSPRPVKPIIYYVDNGVPEPIRTALVEGCLVGTRV